jgi:hypothetical protein
VSRLLAGLVVVAVVVVVVVVVMVVIVVTELNYLLRIIHLTNVSDSAIIQGSLLIIQPVSYSNVC